MSERLEKQQATARDEMARIKVGSIYCASLLIRNSQTNKRMRVLYQVR